MSKIILGTIFVFIVLIGGLVYMADRWDAYKLQPLETVKDPSQAFIDWKDFTPPSGRFKVNMPSTPHYARDAVDIPNTDKKRQYEMYASEKVNGSLFMINVITYPKDVDTSNSEEILKLMVEELMKSNPENQLVSLKQVTYQSHPALEFNINNAKFKVQGKMFMWEKTLYVLSYVARKEDFDITEYNHFMNSFILGLHQ